MTHNNMSDGYWADINFASAVMRGGTWEAAHRLARRTDVTGGGDTERASLKQVAEDAGVHWTTAAKWIAALEWAAIDKKIPYRLADLKPTTEFDYSHLTIEEWRDYYKQACINAPPWDPSARPLEPRTGANRHVSKKDLTEMSMEDLQELLESGDPTTVRRVREALRKIDQARALANASAKNKGSNNPAADELDEQWEIVLKLRALQRVLKDLVGPAMNIGGPNSDVIRQGIVEEVVKARMLLDAVEIGASGESLDDELSELLEEI